MKRTTLTDYITGIEYTVEIEPNSFYPTLESMFGIYLGVQNKSTIDNENTYSFPTVKASLLKYLVVITCFLI